MSPAASWALMAGVVAVAWLLAVGVLIPLIRAGSGTQAVRRAAAWADVDTRLENQHRSSSAQELGR